LGRSDGVKELLNPGPRCGFAALGTLCSLLKVSFRFLVDRSKLAFVGVIVVQISDRSWFAFSDCAVLKISRRCVILQECKCKVSNPQSQKLNSKLFFAMASPSGLRGRAHKAINHAEAFSKEIMTGSVASPKTASAHQHQQSEHPERAVSRRFQEPGRRPGAQRRRGCRARG